jgi:GT2 family glycosyltransferase
MPVMRTAVVIPTLGAPSISSCLAALARQDVAAERVVVVHSGPRARPQVDSPVQVEVSRTRLGFAAACNRGIALTLDDVDAVALLNDDAEPSPSWLKALTGALGAEPGLAAVQGTVTDAQDRLVDGRGLGFDRWGLPVQQDRGQPLAPEPDAISPRCGVSATAALYRASALNRVRLPDGAVFDESFDCYHEDADLALRLLRCGLRSAWVPGAHCRHLGSHTAGVLGWRHPWWLAANRWRALAGNLEPLALLGALPRLLRGELRVLRTLVRSNPRAWATETGVLLALPLIVARAAMRRTPCTRLRALPEPIS